MKQKITLKINLELTGDTSWEAIEKILSDIGYVCNERGYNILRSYHYTTTKIINDEEELLSAEEMTL